MAMNPTIITALIGAGGSLLGALFGVMASAKLTNYRIEQLERKVDRHNSLIERTYGLETREKVLEQRVTTLEERNNEHT
jgi:ABC-type lipoprotein release transport system permease subunit